MENYLVSGVGIHINRRRIQWVIVGGESGPHARPMQREWAASIQGQAERSRVPFLFKQWGAWVPHSQLEAEQQAALAGKHRAHTIGGEATYKLAKEKAGRLLNGRVYHEFPQVNGLAIPA